VQALLDKGADVNAKMNNGVTAPMLAHDANVRAILVRQVPNSGNSMSTERNVLRISGG